MKNVSLKIGWLYPDLMSTYGDRGNIITLTKRLEWRKIESTVVPISINDDKKLLEKVDLIFMGGAQDREQTIVSSDFQKGKSQTLSFLIEKGIPGLYICGAYQFLGKYYREADGTEIKGLGILDLYTENPGNQPRLIGNTVISVDFLEKGNYTLVGFENHGGRTYLGESLNPFGKVIKGYGNNGTDKSEGALYKNTFGSYFHGPILPKNPSFADHLLTLALQEKYKDEFTLSPLDDTIEIQAHKAIVSKLTGRV